MLGQRTHPLRSHLDEPLGAPAAPRVRVPHTGGQIALPLQAIEGGIQGASLDLAARTALELAHELRAVALAETQCCREDEVFNSPRNVATMPSWDPSFPHILGLAPIRM